LVLSAVNEYRNLSEWETHKPIASFFGQNDMSDPIPLYRYLDSDAALKTVVARAFRVGKPSNFNDPFEWRLGMAGINPDLAKQVIEGFLSEVNASRQGILCFSDTVSDPVLWSIYAEKHRGVAFEIKHAWPPDHLHQMTYTEERPVIDVNRLRGIGDHKALDEYLLPLLGRAMRQKSRGWSFEREYRVFVDINNLQHCKFSDGHYYWQIPDSFLSRVILGFRCPLEVSTIGNLLKMNGLMDTKVVRAEMCMETYAIKC
jgi:hypothetical protein